MAAAPDPYTKGGRRLISTTCNATLSSYLLCRAATHSEIIADEAL